MMFQLLGVVTYNCDQNDSEVYAMKHKFQLLGVVTYNCDLFNYYKYYKNGEVSVIRSSNL